MTTTATYVVEGMSCQHCVNAVTAEVRRIPGVEHVQIDLTKGAVTVTSAVALELDAVRAAVDEAGFQLLGGGG